jgi:GntR family transcriptional regulator, transcriptional repressor for pyruvate dehydrogenase complex
VAADLEVVGLRTLAIRVVDDPGREPEDATLDAPERVELGGSRPRRFDDAHLLYHTFISSIALTGDGANVAAAADFPALDLTRASDAVTRALIDGIRAGAAPPGTRLPRDSELAAHFGVSRPVVRQALDLLRRAGIVDVRRGNRGGVFVRSLAIPTELLTERTRLGLEETTQLLEARRTIETTCALLAAERASEAGIGSLEQLALGLDGMREAPEDFIELDVRFHLRLAALSGNEVLQSFLANVFRELAVIRAQYPVGYGDMDTAIGYQLDTVAALRTREPETVLTSMDRHLRGLEGHFLGRNIELRRNRVA